MPAPLTPPRARAGSGVCQESRCGARPHARIRPAKRRTPPRGRWSPTRPGRRPAPGPPPPRVAGSAPSPASRPERQFQCGGTPTRGPAAGVTFTAPCSSSESMSPDPSASMARKAASMVASRSAVSAATASAASGRARSLKAMPWTCAPTQHPHKQAVPSRHRGILVRLPCKAPLRGRGPCARMRHQAPRAKESLQTHAQAAPRLLQPRTRSSMPPRVSKLTRTR